MSERVDSWIYQRSRNEIECQIEVRLDDTMVSYYHLGGHDKHILKLTKPKYVKSS